MISRKLKSSLPLPFFAGPYPTKGDERFVIDEEMFAKFKVCIDRYEKHHGEDFANINRSQLHSSILDEIKLIQIKKRRETNKNTYLKKARSSSHKLRRRKKKKVPKSYSAENIAPGKYSSLRPQRKARSSLRNL